MAPSSVIPGPSGPPGAAVVWDWDPGSGHVEWSPAIALLLGCPPDAIEASMSWWRRSIHPDDAGRVAARVDAALTAAARRWSERYRIRRADGSVARVLDHGFIVRDGDRVVRVVGAIQAIGDTPASTDRADLLERLEDSEEQFRTFVESLPLLVWTATPSGWIDFYNQRWYEYTGSSLADQEGWGWVAVHDPHDLPRMLRVWRRALETGQPWEDEFRLRRASDGMLRWHLSRAVPIRDRAGTIVRWFGTNTDIHDQKQALEEHARLLAKEQQARQEAETSNRAKDEFLAVVSHELRTPLNAMLGWAQLLRRGLLAEDKRDTAIEKIERSARVQGKLIEDLLDVSRIIGGKLEIDRHPVTIVKPVHGAIDAVRPQAQARSVEIHLLPEGDAAQTIVLGSAERLQQIVTNLLSNAVKFSKEGGRVDLHVRAAPPMVEIAVVDAGAGIDPAFLPRLFERFKQADGSSTRRHGGLGLGLSIVRHLTLLHGGTVRAHSDGPGQGSIFVVSLPVADASAAPIAPIAPERSTEMVSLHGVKILAVDDDGSARDVISEVLLACGATVTVAGSVAEALRYFRLDRPDVVVSDIAMPDVDGYALVERIRALPDPEDGAVPLVALTAYASVEDQTRALNAGFDHHVAKPVDPAMFSRLLAHLVQSRLLP